MTDTAGGIVSTVTWTAGEGVIPAIESIGRPGADAYKGVVYAVNAQHGLLRDLIMLGTVGVKNIDISVDLELPSRIYQIEAGADADEIR